jgi:hypothetical protein
VEGAIPLPGAARLRGCDRVARHATRLNVHASPVGTTAWVLDVPGGRFTLVLSPDPFRGFSGEGSLLMLLAHPEAEQHGRRLLAELGWAPTIDAAQLARVTGCSHEQVAAGLAWLAASGRLGYDLEEGAWFHRELPIDSEKVVRRNPRLVAARELLEQGGVVPGAGGWLVRASAGGHYAIPDVDPLRCECQWERERAGSRGPCKHLLAVMLRRTPARQAPESTAPRLG